ncbi:GATA zinc finger domain-containing protein 14-like [Bicyclus anynana]|uniref:GATA zinc finger domain-containing protein 14-like n=1 Tax=Bicyclus anynana TaxID=110368 RepID=A0A6J1N511_BICAN|nr:GATA zinc finger domain-containing protein 14-like [Bicyclus anynana]
MEGFRNICFITLCLTAFNGVTSTIKESLNIPEKIIGGVIDIVQSHKNKPVPGQQPSYPPNYQYPQYQQWNGQSNYQSQGYQPQPQFQNQQFQNQGQYTNYPQGNNNFPQGGNNNFPQGSNNNFPQGGNNNFPQNGNNFPQNGNSFGSTSSSNFASNQGYPAGSGQSFNQGQSQGQYQGSYPNGQSSNNQPNTQSGYYTQSQSTNQYQGTNTGTGQYTGQPGYVGQSNGQSSQGFYVNGVPPAGQGTQGPTCVCQAWTKPPQEVYADTPVTEKTEKKEPAKERMIY